MSVRTSFEREFNTQTKIKSGQANRKRKKYEYFDQLLFLVPTLAESPTVSDIPPVSIQQLVEQRTPPIIKTALVGPSIEKTVHNFAQPSIQQN